MWAAVTKELFRNQEEEDMSKFYGQVFGSAETSASRRGFKDIRASVQSYEGSVITNLIDNHGKTELVVEVNPDSSSSYGRQVFRGSIEEFVKKMEA